MKLRVALFVLLMAVIGSCMVGPKYKQPTVSSPDKYLEDTTVTVNADSLAGDSNWFALFNDTVLVDLIQVGLDSNLDVMIASRRIEEARAQYGFARADLFPAIGYTGDYRHFSPSGNSNLSTTGNVDLFRVAGTVSWELDFWGKLRHSKNQALHQLMALEESKKAVQLSLIAEIATTYFSLRDLDNKLEITQRTVLSRKTGYDIIAARFEKGYVAEIDKLQAEQQLEDAIAYLYQFERQSLATERALCILLGMSPGKLPRGLKITEQSIAPYIPQGLPSELLSRRPDLRSREKQLEAQYDRIGMAVAMRYPSFQLTGILGLASSDLTGIVSGGSGTSFISAALTGPLFNFGKNRRRVEIEKQRMEQMALEYEKNYLVALSEVDNGITGIRTLKEEVSHRKKQVEAARRVLELSKARYDSGYVNYLEVLNSETNLFTAEMLYSTVNREYAYSYVNLYKAFGGGW